MRFAFNIINFIERHASLPSIERLVNAMLSQSVVDGVTWLVCLSYTYINLWFEDQSLIH